ncbi:tetratricopeptide repeat protein [Aeriscardovia aeriphila]|uniref:Thioredoxin n=1 Tax=Aeriscardovia aeriphila TaxID=218139 RepID=A0A261FCE4_9BIFI|nr:tetratricopeptide repeat protein [Aeriscardovia aeriphila]NYI26169.1 putative thioredoxin [Aeriscardovia aeriphila]OZG56715.1 thioredoxin [Aeriscardovia aeriphila]
MADKQEKMNVGISLAGAVDLSTVAHHVDAKPGEKGGAPKAGGYTIDVTTESFESVVRSSQTYPVLLYVWIADDDRLFKLTEVLHKAVDAQKGGIQLARIDAKKYPAIAQALQLQGVPALVLLLGGRPIPITQGVPDASELAQMDRVVARLVELAHKQGISGTAPHMESSDQDSQDSESSASDGSDGYGTARMDAQADAAPSETSETTNANVPPTHQKAHDLAAQGDFSGAALEYGKVLEADPSDRIAAREHAKALLLARSATANVNKVREAAAANPDDVDAQLAVADVDLIGGFVDDAFSRLLDFAASHREALDEVRKRLVSYFPICRDDDPRVARARRRLSVLLY